MKKQISVFQLMVRTSLWKVLLIMLGLLATQFVLFFVLGAGEEQYLLDVLERLPYWPIGIGLYLISAALYIPLSDRGGRMNNLILRLGLSEKQIYWIQVLFNALVYTMFLVAQAMTMILLCLIHDWVTPGTMDPMSILVTSYQHPVFHRLFPLHDLVSWFNLLVLVTGMSICTAAYPMRQRHRFGSVCTVFMVAYASSYFCSLPDLSDHLYVTEFLLPLLFTICVCAVSLGGVYTMEVDDYGKT